MYLINKRNVTIKATPWLLIIVIYWLVSREVHTHTHARTHRGVNSGAPEGLAVTTPHVTPMVHLRLPRVTIRSTSGYSYQLFYTIKIVPDWRFFAFLFCWHFSYRTCAFCKARSDWLQLPLAALHINRHRVTSKTRLTMPRVKMSRADRNPWQAKMHHGKNVNKKEMRKIVSPARFW
jgi:hypothetical protein